MALIEYFISSELLKEILESLNYLHTFKLRPIIHRILNLENNLVTKGKNGKFIKIGDFGLSVIRKSIAHFR